MPFDNHHADHMRQMQDQHRRQQQQMSQLMESQRQAAADAQRLQQWQDAGARRLRLRAQRGGVEGMDLEAQRLSKTALLVVLIVVVGLAVGGLLLFSSLDDETGPVGVDQREQQEQDFEQKTKDMREEGRRECLASGQTEEACAFVYGPRP